MKCECAFIEDVAEKESDSLLAFRSSLDDARRPRGPSGYKSTVIAKESSCLAVAVCFPRASSAPIPPQTKSILGAEELLPAAISYRVSIHTYLPQPATNIDLGHALLIKHNPLNYFGSLLNFIDTYRRNTRLKPNCVLYCKDKFVH